ncbi:MAG: hypothetical protein NTV74_03930 [Euryarchaeota archaeon]|nr:hypothetical protein [Euryarchaeota archaeon]
MRRTKISVLMAILVVLATFVFAITVDAANMKTQQANQIGGQKQIINFYKQQSLFNAEITFTLYDSYGCGCTPIRNASITAWGLDVDDNTSGTTDTQGKCILLLQINYNYRVTIEANGFQTVVFDFLVIDDQTFVFHLNRNDGANLNVNEVSLHSNLIRSNQIIGQ